MFWGILGASVSLFRKVKIMTVTGSERERELGYGWEIKQARLELGSPSDKYPGISLMHHSTLSKAF